MSSSVAFIPLVLVDYREGKQAFLEQEPEERNSLSGSRILKLEVICQDSELILEFYKGENHIPEVLALGLAGRQVETKIFLTPN
jgi:hypothetical protein